MPLLLLALAGCPYVTQSTLDARFDLDGDGVARPDDCDDGDPSVGIILRYEDADRDGFGNPDVQVAACEVGPGAVDDATDCDDSNPSVSPGATERCNGLDDDCDATIDGASAIDVRYWFPDQDHDGFGSAASAGVASCEPAGTYVDNSDDCDDSNAGIRDYQWFRDGDGDGYGDAGNSVLRCSAPAGFVRDDTDCDDADAEVHPGALEICDDANRDEDCSGTADDEAAEHRPWWYRDADGDGWGDIHDRLQACSAPDGYVGDDSDCDDRAPDPYPQEDCPFVDVTVGDGAACGVRSNGRLQCEATGAWNGVSIPPGGILDVAIGRAHACAIDVEGALSCWAQNPADIANIESFQDEARVVSVDVGHTCVVDDHDEVRCWGDGIAYTVSRAEPFVDVEAGTFHACALYETTASGGDGGYGVECFGACRGDGECDDPAGSFTQVAAGDGFSCGLRTSGVVSCWGRLAFDLPSSWTYAHISAYGEAACALTTGGTLVCWGDGTGVTVDDSGAEYVAMDVGPNAFCTIDTGGRMACGMQP